MSLREFKITLEIDESVSNEEVKNYIESAVWAWGKGGDPDNPLFHIDEDDLEVEEIDQ